MPSSSSESGRRVHLMVALVAAWAIATPCRAQPLQGSADRPPPGHVRILKVPATSIPPLIDGQLDEPAWRGAAVADRFWISEQERWPGEQTEVLVTADRRNLYFAFKVYVRQPNTIVALQTRRDGDLGLDDQVAVQLDPFLTYSEISTYSVNALGTQRDAIAGGRARQLAWKGEWQAAVARTDFGWVAEVALPFEILNFQPGTSAVGVNFLRYNNRTAEWSRWADITPRALPEEMGQLVGLDPSLGGRSQPWTLLPYVMAGRNIPDRNGEIRKTQGAAGMDIRYEPQPNLTGVFSVRPDFSQIEQAVTSVDFSYNEKSRDDFRPFFQEGAAYLGDDKAYFYSNRVPNFDLGAKVFGRTDGYRYGSFVTRSPHGRTDIVANLQRQYDRTHNLSAMLVSTDRPEMNNRLYAVRGSGRDPSGFRYLLDVAGTDTDPGPGSGTHIKGTAGWASEFWSMATTVDRYGRDFFPANGLLAKDLPDTSGKKFAFGYYRDRPDGTLREVKGDLSWEERETSDGLMQRRTTFVGGSVELREIQMRLGSTYYAGPYRPVGSTPGTWRDTTNDDRYWNVSADFNTRSSWLGYGVAHSSGSLGGGHYGYLSGYIWSRPTRTTSMKIFSERLESFGIYRQTVVTAGWDVTPHHTIAGRYITAYYGKAYRLAYVWRARRNLDVFAVYDESPGIAAQFSVKMLMTYQ